MFCNQCGAALTENAKFCPDCGHKVEPADEAPHSQFEGSIDLDNLTEHNEPPVTHPPRQETPNYFVRLFNGDIPLVITYWVWGVLVVGMGSRFALLIFEANYSTIVINENGELYRNLFNAVVFGLSIFILVAIWRSASKYTGSPGWAALAKFLVVTNSLAVLANFSTVMNVDTSATAIADEMRMMNKSLPIMVDAETRLDRVDVQGKDLTYNYTTVKYSLADLDKTKFIGIMESLIKKNACKEKETQVLVNDGYNMIYGYSDKHNKFIGRVVINQMSCL